MRGFAMRFGAPSSGLAWRGQTLGAALGLVPQSRRATGAGWKRIDQRALVVLAVDLDQSRADRAGSAR
jgi:hypothetical protein